MKRIRVKNHQGQTRDVDPVDLERWKRKGYLPEPQKAPVKKPEKKSQEVTE